jgi:hypothetical protein
MRPIKFFVVTQTDKQYPAIVEDSFEKGMIYPAPHYYIFKMDYNSDDEEYKIIKMRPLFERCGTVRDSILNANGVGILIHNPDGSALSESAKQKIAMVIKSLVDDFGIIQYQIVSDEISDEAFVDTTYLPALVSATPSMFNKRIQT